MNEALSFFAFQVKPQKHLFFFSNKIFNESNLFFFLKSKPLYFYIEYIFLYRIYISIFFSSFISLITYEHDVFSMYKRNFKFQNSKKKNLKR